MCICASGLALSESVLASRGTGANRFFRTSKTDQDELVLVKPRRGVTLRGI